MVIMEEVINIQVRVKISYEDKEGKKQALKYAKECVLGNEKTDGSSKAKTLTSKVL